MPRTTGARKAQPPKTRATCRCCHHTRPAELMAQSRGKPSTLCKSCDADRASARWHADPEASRAKRRARRQRHLAKERAQAKARYWKDPEKHRAAARERARSERGRASNRKAVARYRQRHPEIVFAQKEAQKAVRRGELARCLRGARLQSDRWTRDAPLSVRCEERAQGHDSLPRSSFLAPPTRRSAAAQSG